MEILGTSMHWTIYFIQKSMAGSIKAYLHASPISH
jgi:hypothetical protein